MKNVRTSDGLARVSYLPGFQPAEDVTPDDVERVSERVAPDFATFFGEAELAKEDVVPKQPAPPMRDGGAPRAGIAPEEDAAQKEDLLGRAKREVRAENVSMHALTRRGMSRWELEKTLLARDLDHDVVEEELSRLETVGLIDDAALAETFVRTQHERKGLGRSALTAELRRRHISQDDIDTALEQVDDDDEQSRATELALKRAPQLHSVDLETAKRRLSAFLMRKGYASSIVRAAVDEALGGRSTSSPRGGRSGGVGFR